MSTLSVENGLSHDGCHVATMERAPNVVESPPGSKGDNATDFQGSGFEDVEVNLEVDGALEKPAVGMSVSPEEDHFRRGGGSVCDATEISAKLSNSKTVLLGEADREIESGAAVNREGLQMDCSQSHKGSSDPATCQAPNVLENDKDWSTGFSDADGGDKQFKTQRLSDEEPGPLHDEFAVDKSAPRQVVGEDPQNQNLSDEDDFGDFGDFEGCSITHTSEVQVGGVGKAMDVEEGDDEDFGDFGDFSGATDLESPEKAGGIQSGESTTTSGRVLEPEASPVLRTSASDVEDSGFQSAAAAVSEEGLESLRGDAMKSAVTQLLLPLGPETLTSVGDATEISGVEAVRMSWDSKARLPDYSNLGAHLLHVKPMPPGFLRGTGPPVVLASRVTGVEQKLLRSLGLLDNYNQALVKQQLIKQDTSWDRADGAIGDNLFNGADTDAAVSQELTALENPAIKSSEDLDFLLQISGESITNSVAKSDFSFSSCGDQTMSQGPRTPSPTVARTTQDLSNIFDALTDLAPSIPSDVHENATEDPFAQGSQNDAASKGICLLSSLDHWGEWAQESLDAAAVRATESSVGLGTLGDGKLASAVQPPPNHTKSSGSGQASLERDHQDGSVEKVAEGASNEQHDASCQPSWNEIQKPEKMEDVKEETSFPEPESLFTDDWLSDLKGSRGIQNAAPDSKIDRKDPDSLPVVPPGQIASQPSPSPAGLHAPIFSFNSSTPGIKSNPSIIDEVPDMSLRVSNPGVASAPQFSQTQHIDLMTDNIFDGLRLMSQQGDPLRNVPSSGVADVLNEAGSQPRCSEAGLTPNLLDSQDGVHDNKSQEDQWGVFQSL